MASSPDTFRQAAVIPLHNEKVCLVLSSNGKRWVLPKGTIERGEAAGEAALREAWEEAGLTGKLCRHPVGSYSYTKNGDAYHVTVFVMEVARAANDWPEGHRRSRRWVATSWAYRCVEEPGLRKLLRDVLPNTTLDVLA